MYNFLAAGISTSRFLTGRLGILFFVTLCLGSFYTWSKAVDFLTVKKTIEKGDLSALKKLKGFSVSMTDKTKRTPLHWAVSYEKPEIVSWLLKQKASAKARTSAGKTPLHITALRKNAEIAKLLVKAGGDIHSLDNKKNSLLHYIFYSQKPEEKQKSFELASFLINKKIKINIKNKNLDTALHLAALRGDLKSVRLLIKNGAKVDLEGMYKQTPIHQLLAEASPPKNYKIIVSEMMKQKFPIGLKDQSGKTILHYASEKGLLDVVKQALSKKANVNMQTPEGWTPLHLASANSHVPVIEFLIKQGADVNLKDKEGMSPLYFAVGSGNKHSVAFLLKSKADVFMTSKTGKSLFDDKTRVKLEGLLAKFFKKEK